MSVSSGCWGPPGPWRGTWGLRLTSPLPKSHPQILFTVRGAFPGASQPRDEGEKSRVEAQGTANYIALGRRDHFGCLSPHQQPPDLRIWGHLLILPAPLTPSSPVPSITLTPPHPQPEPSTPACQLEFSPCGAPHLLAPFFPQPPGCCVVATLL